jgi:hypothetical protein
MFSSLPFIIAVIYCFEGTFWQKLSLDLLVINANSLIGFSMAPIAASIAPQGSPAFYGWLMGLMTALYALALALCGTHLRDFFPRLFSIGRRGWIFCAAGILLSRTVVGVVSPKSFTTLIQLPSTDELGTFSYYVIIFASLWCLLSVLVAVWATYKRAEQTFKIEQTSILLAAARSQYDKLSVSLDDARKLRHDIRYKEAAAAELAKKGDLTSLRKLFATQETAGEVRSYCENAAADALLGWHAGRFAAEDIPFTVRADIPARLHIPESDLCVLLGNLLENALEANRKIPKEKRFTKVEARAGEQLALSVENAFNGHIKKDSNGLPLSTKESGGGYGLRSARALCQKHKGELITEWKSETFSALALL